MENNFQGNTRKQPLREEKQIDYTLNEEIALENSNYMRENYVN